jgi:hypothetical protein
MTVLCRAGADDPGSLGLFFSVTTGLTRQSRQMRYDQKAGAGPFSFVYASDFEPGGLLSVAAALFIMPSPCPLCRMAFFGNARCGEANDDDARLVYYTCDHCLHRSPDGFGSGPCGGLVRPYGAHLTDRLARSFARGAANAVMIAGRQSEHGSPRAARSMLPMPGEATRLNGSSRGFAAATAAEHFAPADPVAAHPAQAGPAQSVPAAAQPLAAVSAAGPRPGHFGWGGFFGAGEPGGPLPAHRQTPVLMPLARAVPAGLAPGSRLGPAHPGSAAPARPVPAHFALAGQGRPGNPAAPPRPETASTRCWPRPARCQPGSRWRNPARRQRRRCSRSGATPGRQPLIEQAAPMDRWSPGRPSCR